MSKTFFRVAEKGESYIFPTEFASKNEALEFAGERVAVTDNRYIVYQAIAELKPERAPIAIVELA